MNNTNTAVAAAPNGETVKVTGYPGTTGTPAGPHARALRPGRRQASNARGVKPGHRKHLNRTAGPLPAVEDAPTGAGVTLHLPPRPPRLQTCQ